MPIKLRGCRWQWTIEHDASGEGVDDEADLRIWRPISHLPPVHASSSEWGVMRRIPLSPLLLPTMWTMWNDVQPQCHHCQLSLSFAALPGPTGNGQWLPSNPLHHRTSRISSLPSTFEAALDLDWKLRPMNRESSCQCPVDNHEAIHLCCWDALRWCSVYARRKCPGDAPRSNISIVRASLAPAPLMGVCTLCTYSSPTFKTHYQPVPVFIHNTFPTISPITPDICHPWAIKAKNKHLALTGARVFQFQATFV